MSIYIRLAKAQAKFKPVIFDATGPFKNPNTGKQNKYASLAAHFDATREALTAEGIAVFHLVGNDASPTAVKCVLACEDGTIESGWVNLAGPNCNAQQAGSAITYAKRYTLSAILGIAGEDDDDGGEAANTGQIPTPPPVAPKAAPTAPAKKPRNSIEEPAVIELLADGKYPAVAGNTAGWDMGEYVLIFDMTKCVETKPSDFVAK